MRGRDLKVAKVYQGFMDKLITANRVVGQLETKLNQLEAPKT